MHQVLGSHFRSAIVFGIPPGFPMEDRTDKNTENMTGFLITNILISLHRYRNRGNEKEQQKYKLFKNGGGTE